MLYECISPDERLLALLPQPATNLYSVGEILILNTVYVLNVKPILIELYLLKF